MEIRLYTTKLSAQSEISWIKEKFFPIDDITIQFREHLVQSPTHYFDGTHH